MNILFFDQLFLSFLRAQPPEIVSKSTTTNIFGTRNEEEEEEQEVNVLSSG
jgi:hypothetical protein